MKNILVNISIDIDVYANMVESIRFALKLLMAAFVFIQNIYIYDVTDKYT